MGRLQSSVGFNGFLLMVNQAAQADSQRAAAYSDIRQCWCRTRRKEAEATVFNRMIEKIEPEIKTEVEHAPTHVPGVLGVHAARARWIGHRVFADLHITVDHDVSVGDSHAIANAVEEALKAHVPSFGEALVHIRPAARWRAADSLA